MLNSRFGLNCCIKTKTLSAERTFKEKKNRQSSVLDVHSFTAHSNIKLFHVSRRVAEYSRSHSSRDTCSRFPDIIRSGVSIEETKISRRWQSFESRRPEIYYSGNYT